MKKDILIYLQSKSWQFLFFEFSTYLFVGTLPLFLKLNTISLWIFIAGAIISSKKRNTFGNLRQNKIFIFATTEPHKVPATILSRHSAAKAEYANHISDYGRFSKWQDLQILAATSPSPC